MLVCVRHTVLHVKVRWEPLVLRGTQNEDAAWGVSLEELAGVSWMLIFVTAAVSTFWAQLPPCSSLWTWGSDSQQDLREARGSSEIPFRLPGCVWLPRVRHSLCALSLLLDASLCKKHTGKTQCAKPLSPSPLYSQRLGVGTACRLPVLQGRSGPQRKPLNWVQTSQHETSFQSPFIWTWSWVSFKHAGGRFPLWWTTTELRLSVFQFLLPCDGCWAFIVCCLSFSVWAFINGYS